MNEFKILKGLNENLPSTKDENTLYHTTDTKRTFIGTTEIQNKVLTNYSASTKSGEELYIQNTDTVEEALGKVETAIINNEETTVESIVSIIDGTGLEEDGTFSSTHPLISGATTVKEAIEITNDTIIDKVGNLTDLTTSRKENLVWAINEVVDIAQGMPQREYVAVNITTEVPTVEVSNIKLYIYIDGITEPMEKTVDESGFCYFYVGCGIHYRIVFPQFVECDPIYDISRTASVREHSIQVTYKEKTTETQEHVTVYIYKWESNVSSVLEGVNVYLKYNNLTQTFVTNNKGIVEFIMPLNIEYSVSVDDTINEGLVCYGSSKQTYISQSSVRNVIFNYRNMQMGLLIMDKDGAEYDYLTWKDKLDKGEVNNEDAMCISVKTSQLLANNGTFLIKIDDILKSTSSLNKQWCTSNVQFNSIPLNGASSSQSYFYDGKTASDLIKNEAVERELSVPAFDYVKTQKLNIPSTSENDLIGFIGSYGQWSVVRNNLSEINVIIKLTRPDTTMTNKDFNYLLSTNHWTSTQDSALSAWCLASEFDGNAKRGSSRVLPFFAF